MTPSFNTSKESSDLLPIYQKHMENALAGFDFTKAARSLKAICVLMADAGRLDPKKLEGYCAELELLGPLMDFTELNVCSNIIRYVRKRIVRDPDYGAGLSREQTDEERKAWDKTRAAYGGDNGGADPGVAKANEFLDDLRSDSDDDIEA